MTFRSMGCFLIDAYMYFLHVKAWRCYYAAHQAFLLTLL